MVASSAHRVQLPSKSDSSNRTATPLAMKTGRELIHKSPEYHHATGDSQNDRATPRPLYMGAKSRTGRGDGPSAVFSTSSLSVTKYENPQKRFLTGFCARAAATAAASGTSFVSTCACAPGFAFSVRCASELPFDGEWSDTDPGGDASETAVERRFQTSLISLSSKSRHVGMMLSRL